MTPEDELLAIITRWHRRVDGLPVWSGSEDRLHALLRTAVWPRSEAARRGREFVDFPWESLLDRVVQWHYHYPLGAAEYSQADVSDAVREAVKSVRIEPLEAGIRAKAFQVKKTRDAFRVTYRWDVSLEVADIYLERQTRPGPLPGPTEAELQWAAGQPRERLNAFSPPPEILQATARRCAAAVGAWRAAAEDPPIPDSFDLGDGLTVGIMAKVLAGLMAMVQLGELAHAAVRHTGTMLFHAPRDTLAERLAEVCEGLSAQTAEAAVLRLMAGRGRSVRSSLLVPNGPVVTVLPLTLFPRAIDPVVLRTAATDPSRYGPIGKKQGERAEAWKLWLRQIPGAKVAERLKLRGPSGQILGDLDLIVVDAATSKGLVLELKWPVGALTLTETTKTDENIRTASRQLGKARTMLRDGRAAVRMPSGWPAYSEVEWTWAVGTPEQLYTGPLPEPEMSATSLRYVKSLGVPPTVKALASALRSPDVPRLGQHYTIEKMTIHLDQHAIHCDSIHALDGPWSPQPLVLTWYPAATGYCCFLASTQVHRGGFKLGSHFQLRD